MGTKSRESIYGSSIRASAERAKTARKEADRLAARLGINACLDTKALRNRLRLLAMP
jgi:hypothetical protein